MPENKTKIQTAHRVLTPQRFGFVVLILLGAGIWAFFFFTSERYEVSSKQTAARISKRVAPDAPDTFIGPQTPPSTQLMYRYTERLEEQTQILLSLLITAYHENLKYRRNPKDLPSLVALARSKKLYLEEWSKQAEINVDKGWVKTARGMHYLFYRARPTPAVEVMSVALDGDVQITVMRAPEIQGSPIIVQNDIAPEGTAGIVVYVAPPQDARLLPAWSSTDEYEQWGWRRENLKISMGNGARQTDLKNWIDSQAAKQ